MNPTNEGLDRRPWSGTSWLAVAVVVVIALAGCSADAAPEIPSATDSDDHQPDQAGASPTPAGDDFDAALAYAQCIRENGVPEWPDPQPDGRFMITRGDGVSFDDPRRQAAMEACQDLRPPGAGGGMGMGVGGGAGPMDEETRLEFARCMRNNGVPAFPDPGASGGPVIFGANSGIDPNDPTFQAAAQHCVSTVLGGQGQ